MRLALITPEKTIRDAIKQLNENRMQILIVVDSDSILLGTVTDGDIRRTVLNGVNLEEPVRTIMNRSPKFVRESERNTAYHLLLKHKIKAVPVVDDTNQVIDLLLMEDFLDVGEEYAPKSNPVVIMAGGKGTRLDPFTRILPKPLIPIGDKPIIEVIMKNFQKYGFNNFILSLNYKAEIIKLYFAENSDGFQISYVQEQEALGTAGALQLMGEQLCETFLVSNCDVILDINHEQLLQYHWKNRNSATIVGVVKNMQIPYGVMKMKGGTLVEMTEKPDYSFVINSGVYVLEPELISLIPKNEPLNMPELLLKAKSLGHKVGVYPVSSNWFDIGQWEEYQHTLDYFKKIDGTYNA